MRRSLGGMSGRLEAAERAREDPGSYARSYNMSLSQRESASRDAGHSSRGSSARGSSSPPSARAEDSRVTSLRDEIAARRARVAELQSSVERVQTSNASLADELVAAQAVNADLQEQIAGAAAERRTAETRLASVRGEATALEDEARALEQVLTDLRAQLAAAEAEEAEHDRAAAAAASEMQSSIARLRADAEAREASIRDETTEAEGRLAAAQKDAARLRDELAEYERVGEKISECKAVLVASKSMSLHKQLAAVTREAAASEARLTAALAEAEAERAALTARISRDSAERDALLQDLAGAVAAKKSASAALLAARRDAALEALEGEATRARALRLGITDASVAAEIAAAPSSDADGAASDPSLYTPAYEPFFPLSAAGRAAFPDREGSSSSSSSAHPGQSLLQRVYAHGGGGADVPSDLKMMLLSSGPDSSGDECEYEYDNGAAEQVSPVVAARSMTFPRVQQQQEQGAGGASSDGQQQQHRSGGGGGGLSLFNQVLGDGALPQPASSSVPTTGTSLWMRRMQQKQQQQHSQLSGGSSNRATPATSSSSSSARSAPIGSGNAGLGANHPIYDTLISSGSRSHSRAPPPPPLQSGVGESFASSVAVAAESPTGKLQSLLDSLQQVARTASVQQQRPLQSQSQLGTHPAPDPVTDRPITTTSAEEAVSSSQQLKSRIAQLHVTAAALQARVSGRPLQQQSEFQSLLRHAPVAPPLDLGARLQQAALMRAELGLGPTS